MPVAERQIECGCYIMVEHRLGLLPTDVPLHWNIAAYPNRVAAEAGRGPRGAVVEALGRVWLMSVAEVGYRPVGGEHLAEVGPLRVEAGIPYTAAYMQGIMLPGAETGVHHHPGPEAILTLAGEECMETPAGKQVGHPGGEPVVVPPHMPHRLTVTGTEERRALALVLHDSAQAWAIRTHEHGWTPQGLCRGD
ncbi:cupin domain-containing protein [Paracraurococcus ruber]|uniref:cupin domain-containing protein n=1 Tax=Paracraurococcus ruber TaxID=77675 RepID=UPI0019616578|nr:cupin domain-containing protein [Paracraurococcus ruber]TDG13143.1 cupin domain-containing protein [Paracraurococcus ruber]